MVSSLTLLPELKTDRLDPEAAPNWMVGAASPLWLLFGGAAAAGATWWWWTARWREAVNLEALSAVTLSAVAPEPVAPRLAAPEIEAFAPAPVEAMIEAATAPIEAVVEQAEIVIEAFTEMVEGALEAPVPEAPPLEMAPVENEPEVAPPEPEPVEIAPVVEAVAEAPVAEASAAVLEASVEAIETLADDLTRLVGIGPKLALALGELGVTRFSQIAAWTSDELASFDQLLALKGRAERDAWVAQAKRFATETVN